MIEEVPGDVAPMVEQLLCKQRVVGSNPTFSTYSRILMGGDSMSIERALVIAILVILFIAVLMWVF
jgi:hypothetical protein